VAAAGKGEEIPADGQLPAASAIGTNSVAACSGPVPPTATASSPM